jgi:hypothetical protein
MLHACVGMIAGFPGDSYAHASVEHGTLTCHLFIAVPLGISFAARREKAGFSGVFSPGVIFPSGFSREFCRFSEVGNERHAFFSRVLGFLGLIFCRLGFVFSLGESFSALKSNNSTFEHADRSIAKTRKGENAKTSFMHRSSRYYVHMYSMRRGFFQGNSGVGRSFWIVNRERRKS